MPHIELEKDVPGIRSLVLFRPETGKPLYELVQILLRGPSTIPEAHRELIAAHVSRINQCKFCYESHAAAARVLAGGDSSIIDDALKGTVTSALPEKITSLLHIAGKVTLSGRDVSSDDIAAARAAGADDREIHDTVLIAATFNLFNRYVDGLATLTPVDPLVYHEMGKKMAAGYSLPKTK